MRVMLPTARAEWVWRVLTATAYNSSSIWTRRTTRSRWWYKRSKRGQLDDPIVTAAIDRVTTACLEARMPLGYFGLNADAVRPQIDRGYTLIVAGVDALLLGIAARQLLTQLR